MAIVSVKVFPSIGVARLGNSLSEFFVGPEIPGARPVPPGGYKDTACRVKRQAARFRVFGFDSNGMLVQEITQADAKISWTVHLANTKASWKRFNGLSGAGPLRNIGVADRASLEIDPGPRTLDAPNEAAGFNTGKFLGSYVPLGEMRTDADGRLLVLGGFGNSASVPPGLPLPSYANNDGWRDDVSDGPVTAIVQLNGSGATLIASPAWVICAPPDFAPAIDSVTTLYDVLFQVAVDNGWLTLPATPSFTADIWPILERPLALQRSTQLAAIGHSSFGAAFSSASAAQRQAIFARVRDPSAPGVGGVADMPRLFDDNNTAHHAITKSQYALLTKWKDGNFVDDWPGTPPPPAVSISPDGLTRAALEACVGAAFFPGIEASWMMRDTYAYSEPFRLDHAGRAAGDVTKQMACPWQADFYECLRDDSLSGLAWWPAQRPDDVFPESGGGPVSWTRDIVQRWQDVGLQQSHQDMVANWHKLGFVVNTGASVVETQRFKVCKNIFLVADHATFSEDEVSGALTGGIPARFDDALFVIAEGFTPSELGITSATPTEAALGIFAPTIIFRRADLTTVPGMNAVAASLLLQDPSLPPTLRQRFTFVYRVEFANADAFSVGGTPVETQVVAATATKLTFSSTADVLLVHQPNPYMLDGPTSWLSTDVRVFQLTAGDSRFGFTLGSDAAAARAYIASVVGDFNNPATPGQPFDTISEDPALSRLELAEQVGGKRVFNFAVARVRYRGKALDAVNVRVFFRLFTTAATGLQYDASSTYRRTPSPQPIALLGLQGGEVVTIPCFASERVDSATVGIDSQTDPLNARTLTHSGASEVFGYFGCWLDFNQTAAYCPSHPTPGNGPWPAERKSIQELIRGLHQCLVAEVNFTPDPIPDNASPASSDNLAQRNLAILESGNPGYPETHTVLHTFEIAATRPAARVVLAPAGRAEEPASVRVVNAGPDELMINWGDLPRDANVTIYAPELDADAILRLAAQSYETSRLERVDAHTIRCLSAGVTYVPLPDGRVRNAAAMLTIVLPETVKYRQAFRLVVRQISGRPRRVLGAFQLSIPVREESAILTTERRALSVLRHIRLAIPPEDPWRAVFDRYLRGIADRVRGLGGDPDDVAPAADGSGRDPTAEQCELRGVVVSLLIALFVVMRALHPPPAYVAESITAAIAVGVALHWRARCGPSACRVVGVAALGVSVGAAFVALLVLFGLAAGSAGVVLAAAALVLAALLFVAARRHCFNITNGRAP